MKEALLSSKREKDLRQKIQGLSAQIARVESTVNEALTRENGRDRGGGMRRLEAAETENLRLENDKHRMDRKLRSERRKCAELKASADQSKRRLDFLLMDKHALIQKVGQLEAKLCWPTPTSPSSRSPKRSQNRSESRECRPEHATVCRFPSEDLCQQEVATLDADAPIELAEPQVVDVPLEFGALKTDVDEIGAFLEEATANPTTCRKAVLSARSRARDASERATAIQARLPSLVADADELRADLLAKQKLLEALQEQHKDCGTETLQLKIQSRETELLRDTLQRCRAEQRRLEEALEDHQTRSWASSCKALEEIALHKRTIRRLKTAAARNRKRQAQLQTELAASRIESTVSSEVPSVLNREVQTLKRENAKLRVVLKASTEKLAIYERHSEGDGGLAFVQCCSGGEEQNRSFEEVKIELRRLREAHLADQEKIRKISDMLFHENDCLLRLKAELRRQKQTAATAQEAYEQRIEELLHNRASENRERGRDVNDRGAMPAVEEDQAELDVDGDPALSGSTAKREESVCAADENRDAPIRQTTASLD